MQVDEVTRGAHRVATPEREVLLLEYARLMTASQLEKLSHKYALVQRHGQDPHPLGDVQRRCVRRRDTEDGMVKIEAVLHPEEAERVWTMLDHAAIQLTRESPPPAIDDSAESGVATQAPGLTVTPLLPDAAVCRSDDSAESRNVVRSSRISPAGFVSAEMVVAMEFSLRRRADGNLRATYSVRSRQWRPCRVRACPTPSAIACGTDARKG